MADPILQVRAAGRLLEDDPEYGDPAKGQMTRMAEVLVLGPYMIWTARNVEHKYFRLGLMMLGFGTIIYNGWNLLRIYRARRGLPEPALGALPGVRSPRVGNRRRLSYIPRHR